MSAVIAVSQRYTVSGSGVRKWCGGGRERCYAFQILAIKNYVINNLNL